MRGVAEFSLVELVEDPLVGLLMKSDGVEPRSVEALFERVARERTRNLRSRLPWETAPCISC